CLIVLNLFRLAFGQLLPKVQDGDEVAYRHHRFHVVLHIENGGPFGAHAAKQIEDLARLGGGKTTAHLVAEQKVGTRRQRARYLQSLLLPQRKYGGRQLRLVVETDALQLRHRLVLGDSRVARLFASEESAEHHVVERRHASKGAHDLVRAHDAEMHQRR